MTIHEYYQVLGLKSDSSIEEIKKAYRKKARECHPDINPAPDAKDLFIRLTEAYEFLVTYREKIAASDESFQQAMDDWRKYRQNRSHKRATVYARVPYNKFKNTNFYKTTRIFDGTTIIASMAVSIMVLLVTVFGYIYRIHHPLPGIENPSITSLIVLLMFGMLLFVISFIYLKAYFQSSKKNKSGNEEDH
jgi:Mg2+ and Co2+ transporter CorA